MRVLYRSYDFQVFGDGAPVTCSAGRGNSDPIQPRLSNLVSSHRLYCSERVVGIEKLMSCQNGLL